MNPIRVAPVALCLAFAAAPAFAGEGDFSAWKRRPAEPFSDGERAFRRVKEMLLKDYADDTLSDDDLWRAAVQGMLAGAGGRPFDKLLSPSELAELKAELSGQVVGIGVEIKFDADSGVSTVIAPLPDSPAERAGLAPGDRILKIDGRSFKGLQQRDVVYAMRGKAGVPVALAVLRDDRVLALSVDRQPIKLSPVHSATLPGNVALITVRAYSEQTPTLLRDALVRAAAAHPSGLVLDLRGNEGGLVDQMVECSSMLLPAGSLVATVVHRAGHEEAIRTRLAPVLTGLPLAVLIDHATASGAELMAGALKAGAGARLVGQRTHGKWNVQRIEDLPNHYAVKFTVGVFKSPWGELLDGKGLDPDIEVDGDDAQTERLRHLPDPTARLAADGQLRAALGVLRLSR